MTEQKILNWWSGAVLWQGEAESLKDALQRAVARGANLTDANLRGADLTDANLRGANLRGADLTDANLRGANLRGANLTDANLRGANLRGADLTDANLTDANLRGADLTDANLTDANLRDANLTDANLTAIRDDLWAVLSSAPLEVPALIAALKEGRVDGSTYQGSCACLVGTLANAKGCEYDSIPGLKPNSSRAAEAFFCSIHPGDTPETSQPAKLALEWAEDWHGRMQAAFSPKPSDPAA